MQEILDIKIEIIYIACVGINTQMGGDMMKAKKDNGGFSKAQADLRANGYREKDVTISSGKAMVLGVICALPFIIILGLCYRFMLIERAYLLEISGIWFYVMFIAIIVVSVMIHELLHGIGWAISSGKGWSVVRFNINAMMPSCACKTALTLGQYLVGVLLPFLVLGTGSVVFLFLYPGTVSVLSMAVNFVAAGADLLIALRVMREKGALIVDHPTQAGFVAFYR